MKFPLLADTLEIIANKGADEFYSGQMAKDIADDVSINSIISSDIEGMRTKKIEVKFSLLLSFITRYVQLYLGD